MAKVTISLRINEIHATLQAAFDPDHWVAFETAVLHRIQAQFPLGGVTAVDAHANVVGGNAVLKFEVTAPDLNAKAPTFTTSVKAALR